MAAVQPTGALLLDAVAELAHARGFQTTTLAQVAEAAGVPPGGVHYHFPTKRSLGEALLARRERECAQARAALEAAYSDPRDRLVAFVHATAAERDELAERGCPFGTLAVELRRSGGPLADGARALLGDWVQWAEAQLRAVGRDEDAPRLAVRLLGELQGAAVMALALGDPEAVTAAAERCVDWIEAL